MPSFRLTRQDTGAPLTTALATGLSFSVYRDRADNPRTAPAITHQGDGIYSFTPSAADVADGIGFLIDCGTNANPPRGAGYVGEDHIFFAGYGPTGVFLAGLAPTISTYVKADGNAAVPVPTISALAGGLYAFTPSTADRINGVRFAIDLGVAAEPNRYPGGDLGDGFSVPADPIAAVVDFTPAGTDTARPRVRDLAFDFVTGTFIRSNGRLTMTQDREAIAQAVTIRLLSFRGEWFLDVLNGVPYLSEILIKNPNQAAVLQTLRREIESVPGVKSVKTLVPTFNTNSRRLSIVWVADSDLGEISGDSTLPQ